MLPDRPNFTRLLSPTVSDAELLRRYLENHDEVAFELLVRRHASAVWRVCRALVRNHHTSEDAFQAVFLTLARRGETIRTANLAGWLCRVAHRAATKLRSKPVQMLAIDPLAEDIPPDDTATLLHAELDKLPEAERVPVVLCHLSGYTQAEAAKELGLPLGTVAARISRALTKLRERLTHRGVALGVIAFGGAVAAEPLVRTVAAFANPDCAVPNSLLALAKEALPIMKPSLLKSAAAVALVGLLLAGAMFVPATADDPKPLAQVPRPAQPGAIPPEAKAKLELLESARRMQKVAQAYRDTVMMTGKLPTDVTDTTGKKLLSWRVQILQYMEQRNVYALTKLDQPWDSKENEIVSTVNMKFFFPVQGANPTYGTRLRQFSGNKAMTELLDGIDPKAALITSERYGRLYKAALPLLVETGEVAPWLKPDEDVVFDPKAKAVKLPSAHKSGTLVATTDGQVHLIQHEPDAATFAEWMKEGKSAKIDPKKLFATSDNLTAEDKQVSDLIAGREVEAAENQKKLADQIARLRRQLAEKYTTPGDVDPLKLVPRLNELERLRFEQDQLQNEVNALETELKKIEKK